ncbi:MAG: hypothetical protein WBB45_17880 [Cyclobacteriaceae bacterium]
MSTEKKISLGKLKVTSFTTAVNKKLVKGGAFTDPTENLDCFETRPVVCGSRQSLCCNP